MNTAVILAAHGSTKSRQINKPMFELADSISNRLNGVFVTPAFLDGDPDVRQIVNKIDHENLLVIPFMTSQGYYTNVVFPKAFRHHSKTVRIVEAIGANPRLADLVDSRIRHLSSKLNWQDAFDIVIVGHGTRKNKNSCRTTIELVKELRGRFPHIEIQFSFIDQNPVMQHAVSRIKSSKVLVIPFLMGLGPHTSQDVPQAFGISDFEDHAYDENFEFPFVKTRNAGLRIDAPSVDTVAYDSPIGTYPELAELCIEHYQEYKTESNDGRSIVGEVA